MHVYIYACMQRLIKIVCIMFAFTDGKKSILLTAFVDVFHAYILINIQTFLDPLGCHCIISTATAENWYIALLPASFALLHS